MLICECEHTAGFKELGHGFFRRGFGVDAHQGLSAAGAKEDPGFGGVGLGFGFGVVEEELDPVEVFLAKNLHAGDDGIAGLEGFGAGDGGVLDVVGNVEVDAAVLVLAVFGLQVGDECPKGLAFFGHDVGEEERVEDAVALGR